MPYISTEEVKKIREDLKRVFPKYRFSVTKEHHSSVHIAVLKGPLAIESQGINVYWYKEHLADKSELLNLIDGIITLVRNSKPETRREDGDYGSVPNYYLHVQIGKDGKPYEQKDCK